MYDKIFYFLYNIYYYIMYIYYTLLQDLLLFQQL